MKIEIAEVTAAYLLENGYGPDVLEKYTVSELQDLHHGAFLQGCEAIATTSKDDPELREYLGDIRHFRSALDAAIDSRKVIAGDDLEEYY